MLLCTCSDSDDRRSYCILAMTVMKMLLFVLAVTVMTEDVTLYLHCAVTVMTEDVTLYLQ